VEFVDFLLFFVAFGVCVLSFVESPWFFCCGRRCEVCEVSALRLLIVFLILSALVSFVFVFGVRGDLKELAVVSPQRSRYI